MADYPPFKLTAMYHHHLQLGATLQVEANWQRPAFYSSLEQELDHIQGVGGFCDASPNGKLLLQGSALDSVLEPVEIGRCSSINLSSGLRVLVSRLSQEETIILTAPGKESSVRLDLETRLSECAHILDVTSGYAGIQVIGPHADHTLSRLTDLDLGILPNLSCAQGMLAEIYALVVRCDVGHQTSYDIYVERSYGEYLWEVFIETGKLLDMIPVGIECIRELSPEGT